MSQAPRLKSCRIHNFKAIRDSGTLKLNGLNVFIGNNGSGKSSIIEALNTYQATVLAGLDDAMNLWGGFEQIHNKMVPQKALTLRGIGDIDDKQYLSNPIAFEFSADGFPESERCPSKLRWNMQISVSPSQDKVFIIGEEIVGVGDANGRQPYASRDHGLVELKPKEVSTSEGEVAMEDYESLLRTSKLHHEFDLGFPLPRFIKAWQFVSLNPDAMGERKTYNRGNWNEPLRVDGSNIAQYLQNFRNRNLQGFNDLLDTLRVVLPYMDDLQPTLAEDLEHTIHLMMIEKKARIPGWLLSTGTLRVLALLALLRDPPGPILIEELENGLDPSTVHLIVNEIRNAVDDGAQVIATTHSPYLLDLLNLEDIVMTQRDPETNEPRFLRPEKDKELEKWAEDFAPGRLYTMGRFDRLKR